MNFSFIHLNCSFCCLRYKLFVLFFVSFEVSAQIIHQIGDYKTISSGIFSNQNIWQVWNGSQWVSAISKPGRSNNIFLDQGHEVTLTATEEAKDVYLFRAASPGKKINLQSQELHVYGALRGLSKSSGNFLIHPVTNAAVDWIYPESGKIVFKGASRVVVDRSSWSASNINSRYTVVFDPGAGNTLTVNAGFKANAFIIQSGTVFQTVNTVGIAACSTFSYNNQSIFNGSGPYGDFIVEANATFISECSAPLEGIIRRSNTTLASHFHLKEGGNLILLGNDPKIEVLQFTLEGNVFYQGNAGTQQMLSSTFSGGGVADTYHHLFFSGNAQKLLRPEIFLTGNFSYVNGGPILDGPSSLHVVGNQNQYVFNWEVNLSEVILNKSGGEWGLSNDLKVKGLFQMYQGKINFNGKNLHINTSGSGGYFYLGGHWRNLNRLIYHQIQTHLTATNASFPFEDQYQGGIRMMQLLGSTPGGNLELEFVEIKGSNWDPNFQDNNGTDILYQLRSYFKFKTSQQSTNPIEMRISAKNLIVDQLQDLRVVSNGQAAPGNHLPAEDPINLWARRDLSFGDLDNTTFTVGSYALLSVLPLTWINQEALLRGQNVVVKWVVAREKNNKGFVLHQSIGGIQDFKAMAFVNSKGDSEAMQNYEMEIPLHAQDRWKEIYFQLEQIDQDGKSSFSEVFRLKKPASAASDSYSFWPNPYQSGDFHIYGTEKNKMERIRIILFQETGKVIFTGSYAEFSKFHLDRLARGLYLLQIDDGNYPQVIKILKQ